MAWNKHAAASFSTPYLQDLQRKLIRHVLLMCLLLTGCATQMITPEKRTHDFYTFYFMAFVTDSKEDNLDSLKMRDYIAQEPSPDCRKFPLSMNRKLSVPTILPIRRTMRRSGSLT